MFAPPQRRSRASWAPVVRLGVLPPPAAPAAYLLDRSCSRSSRSGLKPFVTLAQTIPQAPRRHPGAVRLGVNNARHEARNRRVRMIINAPTESLGTRRTRPRRGDGARVEPRGARNADRAPGDARSASGLGHRAGRRHRRKAAGSRGDGLIGVLRHHGRSSRPSRIPATRREARFGRTADHALRITTYPQ